MTITETRHLSIPSVRSNINLVEKLVNEICQFYNVGEEHYANILVALSEAITNAMHHGNNYNAAKCVSFSYETRGNALCFSVIDEGSGFDLSQVPDPTDPDNIEKPGGRGIFIMQRLSDKVEFHDNGRRVDLYFNLSLQ